jgi:predicted amidohydrolase
MAAICIFAYPWDILDRGIESDLFLFELEEGDFAFVDVHGKRKTGSRRIVPRVTVRAGKAYSSGSVAARLREAYGCDEAVFASVPPVKQ